MGCLSGCSCCSASLSLTRERKRADLKNGVTEASLHALVEAGCGARMTVLRLEGGLLRCCRPFLLCLPLAPLFGESERKSNTDVSCCVTDATVGALAEAGCGKNLTSLRLDRQCRFFFSLWSTPSLRFLVFECLFSFFLGWPLPFSVFFSPHCAIRGLLFFSLATLFCLLLSFHRAPSRRALKEIPSTVLRGLTDTSFRALSEAGCGEKLTSLHLSGECFFPHSHTLLLSHSSHNTRRSWGGCHRFKFACPG